MNAQGHIVAARRDTTIPILVFGALGTLIFICTSALTAYMSTKQLIASRDWREHSQEVLTTLLAASQHLDRINLSSRLYLMSKNASDMDAVQANTVSLDTYIVRLNELVQNTPAQAARVGRLRNCTLTLKRQVAEVLAQGDTLQNTILECRDEISKLQEAERSLFTQRTEESQKNLYRSLLSGGAFVFLSLLVVAILFGMLLRDVRKRYEVDQKIFSTNAKLESNVVALQRRAADVVLLMSARKELQLCTTPEQAHHAVVRFCQAMLPSTRTALLIINNSRHMVEVAASSDDTINILDGFGIDACCGLRSGRLRWRRPQQSEVHCNHFEGAPPENYLCIPLTAHGDTLGILYVECPDAAAAMDVKSNLENIEELTELASMCIASLNLRASLEHQSIRDALTSLFNRHFMEISLDREVHRAERNQSSLSLFMLDVDHFKKFNDTYGHEAGDLVLKEVAHLFTTNSRGEDVICRYGGEEFVIILPEMSQMAAFQKAERLRKSISEMRVRFHDKALPPITISIGIAVYPQSGLTMEHLLRNADRALYSAKHNGRNRIAMSESNAMELT